MPSLERLSAHQRTLLEQWLPGAVVEHDHSWGLLYTVVLELAQGGQRWILKAGGPDNHHLVREIHAHEHWLAPWTTLGRAQLLRRADVDARLLLTSRLAGELDLGTPYAVDLDVHRQAGHLLALLHAQHPVPDPDHEGRQNERSLAWLDGDHRIAPTTERRLRELIDSWPTPPAMLVPTHGDWQPRNWLMDHATLRVIDLGRAARRPAATDLARLATQEWRDRPDLESAFLEGYGDDPREPAAWRRILVREAIGTAVWAYQVGDRGFEEHGHRLLAETTGDDAL